MSESLNITSTTTGGALLLAASAIVENAQLEFEDRLKLITGFRFDFADDGLIASENTKNLLLTSAFTINHAVITDFIKSHYGVTNIPDFESILKQFVSASTYVNYFNLIFPKPTDGSINLFRDSTTVLDKDKAYVFLLDPGAVKRDTTLSNAHNDGYFGVCQFWSNDLYNTMDSTNYFIPQSPLFTFQSGYFYSYQALPLSTLLSAPLAFGGSGTVIVTSQASVNGLSFGQARTVKWQ